MPENEHTINALVRKRAELAGEVEATEKFLMELRLAVAHVDHTIKLFDPDFEIAGIKAKRLRDSRNLFYNGDATRLVFDILRDAPEPLNVAAIVAGMIKRKGFGNSKDEYRVVEKRVDRVLRRRQDKGLDKLKIGPHTVVWWVSAEYGV